MEIKFIFKMVLVVAVCICFGYQTQGTRRQLQFIKRNGFRNNGGIIASILAESGSKCSAVCTIRSECNSFNLGPVLVGTNNRKLCDLVKTDQNSLANITEVPGWSLFLREFLMIDPLSICV